MPLLVGLWPYYPVSAILCHTRKLNELRLPAQVSGIKTLEAWKSSVSATWSPMCVAYQLIQATSSCCSPLISIDSSWLFVHFQWQRFVSVYNEQVQVQPARKIKCLILCFPWWDHFMWQVAPCSHRTCNKQVAGKALHHSSQSGRNTPRRRTACAFRRSATGSKAGREQWHVARSCTIYLPHKTKHPASWHQWICGIRHSDALDSFRIQVCLSDVSINSLMGIECPQMDSAWSSKVLGVKGDCGKAFEQAEAVDFQCLDVLPPRCSSKPTSQQISLCNLS